jgi:hypothetical protein
MRSAKQVLAIVRKHTRNNGMTLAKLPKRGKGSHTIWAIRDANGQEVARLALTGHTGAMSHTVTRNNELALESIFGIGWMDK